MSPNITPGVVYPITLSASTGDLSDCFKLYFDPVSRHHLQTLAAIYNTVRMGAVIAQHRRTHSLDGMFAFQLIRELRLIEVMTPAHATDDINAWSMSRNSASPTRKPPRKRRNDERTRQ